MLKPADPDAERPSTVSPFDLSATGSTETSANAPATSGPSRLTPIDLSGSPSARPREIGGPPGPEPTRFGDWEKKGRCIDF